MKLSSCDMEEVFAMISCKYVAIGSEESFQSCKKIFCKNWVKFKEKSDERRRNIFVEISSGFKLFAIINVYDSAVETKNRK